MPREIIEVKLDSNDKNTFIESVLALYNRIFPKRDNKLNVYYHSCETYRTFEIQTIVRQIKGSYSIVRVEVSIDALKLRKYTQTGFGMLSGQIDHLEQLIKKEIDERLDYQSNINEALLKLKK